MAVTKSKQKRTKKTKIENPKTILDLEKIEYSLAKAWIRAAAVNGIADEIIRSQINSGLLGFETEKDGTPKKDPKGQLIPKTIARSTYYEYKAEAISLDGMKQDFQDFARIEYAVQVSGVKAMLQVLVNIMFTSVMAESNLTQRAKLAHNLFQDLPNYTQFLDIEKEAIVHKKIDIATEDEGDGKKR